LVQGIEALAGRVTNSAKAEIKATSGICRRWVEVLFRDIHRPRLAKVPGHVPDMAPRRKQDAAPARVEAHKAERQKIFIV
jgi:hypothetical protein